jgi:putative ABC transport system permease protein
VVTTLDRKLLRDLWRMRGQALAVALVLAAATATFVLATSVHGSLTDTRDAYYSRNNFADVFAEMTRAPRSVIARVAEIPGVQRAEGSILQYGTLDFPDRTEPVRALIASVDERGRTALNQVTLLHGRLPRPGEPGEAIADESFAIANELSLGDTVDAVIYGTRQRLTLVGIGLAPNYIYALPPGDFIPDNRRFGIFWMGREALEAATDRTEAINALAIRLQRGASEADVIRQVDALLGPYGGTGAYGRDDHPSHAFLDNELMQLEAMTTVIPPVFLVVAVFLVQIVLGRMIRTERMQIGLLKAFGYSDAAVGWHYLKFALAIAAAAILLGTLAGLWMGRAMTGLYAEYYRFPFLSYRISPPVFVAAAGLSFGAAAIGALGGMRSAVRLNPAVAMSPPPPPVYRAGLVERVGQKAGFTTIGHMIVRHIARWPGRSAVTVFGVSLAAALLFSTLQFLDASRTMIDSFFLRAQQQDLTVTFIEPRNEDALFELRQIAGVLRVEPTRALAVKLSNGNLTERTAIETTVPNSRLTARIDADGSEIDVPPAGLMLSRQLANQLDLRAGDQVHVELLGGRRTETMIPVASIVNEFVGARAYAPSATLESLARDASPVGAALLRIDPAARESILAELKRRPVVLGVTERDASVRLFEEMIEENLLTMLFFYILFASAIAVGVVYNSARILFSEREHELATLRVLGFYRSEVGVVLLGELALLIAAAILPGCVIGYWMAQLMTDMFSSDLFRLPFAPSRASFGWAIVIVLTSALATAFLVALRVLRLDLVAVLKARD